jgi:NADH-quinone oxidoreductase subunit D
MTSPRTISVAVGIGSSGVAHPGRELTLDLGPGHPSAHGLLRLVVTVEDGLVTRAEPVVGYMHRGAEKLFEFRDYRQIVMLANRHDWLSAFASELGVVLAVERLAGVAVPATATWLRTLLAELNRVLAHLAFLGSPPPGLGGLAAVEPAGAARTRLLRLMEELTGGRVHFMFNRVGGLREPAPAGWLDRARSTVANVRTGVAEVAAGLLGDEQFRAATRGVGTLPADVAAGFGVSGPPARASGLDLDLRRDEPYLGYADLTVRVVTREPGDALARYECLADQCVVSLELADRCLDVLADLPPRPVAARLPPIVRAPEGETYVWTENPLGINGYYLVSRGGATPWRLKLRSASFNNVQALRAVLPGTRLADLVTVLASLFFVTGDIDR